MTEIGKIVTTRGIRGEVKILPFTNVNDMFDGLDYVYIEGKKYDIESVKHVKTCVALKLSGIETPEDAATYVGKKVKIDDADLKPLAEDEYYIKDLVGAEITNFDTDETDGVLRDVILTGGNDVLDILSEDKKQILVPLVKEFVKNIDIKNKQLSIHFIEGMLEE